MPQSRKIFTWALSLLACLPLLLFAYMGWHTRMIHDDFSAAAIGLEHGAWGGLVFEYERWTSAYSTIFLRFALAEYAVALPPLFTLGIIIIGLLGLYWLSRQVLEWLALDLPERPAALAISALSLAAAINAFYTPESFYWYSANIQYTVPLVCLLLCLALAGWLVRSESRKRLLGGSLACGLICFLTAGASEMFLVFQAAFLTLGAALALVIIDKRRRKALIMVASAMLLATALSALVHLASPGIWQRAARDAVNYGEPIRSLSQLAQVTIQITFESIGRSTVIAGFTLLAALGLALGLRSRLNPVSPSSTLSPSAISRAAVAGLALQVLFLPILWAHQSDAPLLLGRFSAAYMAVIALNLALLLGLLALWRWRRLQLALAGRERGLPLASSLLLGAYLLLIAMTQLRSIDSRASTYLFASALSMLLMLALLWQPSDDTGKRQLGLAALGILIIAWLTIAALISVTFIGHGFTSHRMMAGSAFLQVSAGFLCGLCLGRLLARCGGLNGWRRLVTAGSLVTVAVVAGGIFLGQARLVPDLQTYAREWDARHQTIIARRDSGQTHIEVAPLTFDLADYIGMGTLRSAHIYYGVQSLTEPEH